MAVVPIVVLAGQSNAYLAGVDNRLFEQLSADGGAFELVKVAVGQTSLFANLDPDWDPASGELFAELCDEVEAAIQHVIGQGHTPVVTTLWIQGEADKNSTSYAEQLTQFIEAYRNEVGAGAFYISAIKEGGVRDQQIEVADALGNVDLIETTDLGFWDGIHYDKASREAIAERFMTATGVVPDLISGYVSLRAPMTVTDIGGNRDEILAPLFEDFIYTHGDRAVRLFSYSGDDQITTGAKNDFIRTGGNNDRVWAGTGDDRAFGGVHDDHLYGQDGNDELVGEEGADYLEGGSGNDILDGGREADVMHGGVGDDVYTVDNVADAAFELAGEGWDEIRVPFVSYVLDDNFERLVGYRPGGGQNLTGNALDNEIESGDGSDTLDGGLGADRLVGGGGDDTYLVDDRGDQIVETADGGTDNVRTSLFAYQLDAGVENLTATSARGQMLTGNDLSNVITGGHNSDIVNGSGGADTLIGGRGNDIYVVDDAADIVVEADGEGVDEVRSMAAIYTLGGSVERLTGISDTGQVLIGNSLNNMITGTEGHDVLDGAAGADRLTGFGGNDAYVVNSLNDVVEELPGGGIDEIRTGLASYALATGEVENLVGLSHSGQSLTGNTAANVITGGIGSDILNGGGGTDTLTGGLGDDTFIVESADDVVLERAGEGTDVIWTVLAAYTLTSLEVEKLIGIGGVGQSLTGNSGDNIIVGGDGNDVLEGGAGNDALTGGAGIDTASYASATGGVAIRMWAPAEIKTGGAGTDSFVSIENVIGSAFDDRVHGDAGRNRIEGGVGNDTVAGLNGADMLVGGDGNDLLNGGNHADTIYGGAAGDELVGASGADVLDGGAGNDELSGGISPDILVGGDGDDHLSGGTQKDTLTGGAGSDTFVFGHGDTDSRSAQADTITDFVQGEDLIDVSAMAVNTFEFLDMGAFSGDGTGGELRYRRSNGNTYVEGDTNGDGVVDFTIKVDGAMNLIVSDFAL